MKKKWNKSQPTIYIFHKRDNNLTLCSVFYVLALALADDAFNRPVTGTALHREYTELENSIRTEKQTLHCKVFEDIRQKFCTTIDTAEIESQLLELSISKGLKMNDENKVQFVFEKRARLAQNLVLLVRLLN
ncbi:hypothetical protein AJ78_02128 [Emergomyces pasteurianus Ep9510]|uniref:Uncharacterized protein n=1 Tax=Emergomyces pasteurianus Ep9510 TaxID=1447872 RepID=A0A1J9QRD6_9EURO|nr:hypothetical protein AJ78_02128 [Emergomyces pasteurianus Ep9510]